MFITVVNREIVNSFPSLKEVALGLRELDPGAAAYVEVFQFLGNGCDIIRSEIERPGVSWENVSGHILRCGTFMTGHSLHFWSWSYIGC